jgi:hypothetical protein
MLLRLIILLFGMGALIAQFLLGLHGFWGHNTNF